MPDTEKVIYVEDLRQRIVEDKQIRGGAFAAVMRHLQETPAVELRCVHCGGTALEIATDGKVEGLK